MKIINDVATCCTAFGLAIFAGSLLFGAGTLSVLGWAVALPLFVGSTGIVALTVHSMIPERSGNEVPADEKNNRKNKTQTA